MNLDKLMTIQADLDKHIEQKKGLQGQDLLDKKILALQVELGELANEWRGFKFWKVNQQPVTFKPCSLCGGRGWDWNGPHDSKKIPCYSCEGKKGTNPLLEEYVDCLHFILSIGLDLGVTYKVSEIKDYEDWDTTQLFNAMYYQLAMFEVDVHNNSLIQNQKYGYERVFNVFLSIGKRLGLTTEQIEQAYLDKNKVNHARQESNY